MAELKKNLGLAEAVGLSIATIAPTLVMAFNVSLAVQFAGPAAPLVFAIGTTMVVVVGLSFVAWSRRMAHAGSAYGYIAHAMGKGWGFLAGWALLLTYLSYAAGTAVMVGNFIDAAVRSAGLHWPNLWVLESVGAVVVATLLARRNMRLAGRVMLMLEGISMLAVAALAVVILMKLRAVHGLSWKPFMPSPEYKGWAGVGYALVFAVLSFGGFEAAATLGEETNDPYRNIPIAILATLLIAGTLYVVVSYAQVIGYGLGNSAQMAKDPAPLDTLAVRYTTRWFAILLDLAAALGSFSCVLGSLSAAGRMIYALARAGLTRPKNRNEERDSLGISILVAGAVSLAWLLGWAPRFGAGNFYGAVGTIGTLALILVYMGVAWAQAKEAAMQRKLLGCAMGMGGVLLLIWPLYNSVYPVPAYPENLWPIMMLAWIACGAMLLLIRPELVRRTIPEVVKVEDDQFDVA